MSVVHNGNIPVERGSLYGNITEEESVYNNLPKNEDLYDNMSQISNSVHGGNVSHVDSVYGNIPQNRESVYGNISQGSGKKQHDIGVTRRSSAPVKSRTAEHNVIKPRSRSKKISTTDYGEATLLAPAAYDNVEIPPPQSERPPQGYELFNPVFKPGKESHSYDNVLGPHVAQDKLSYVDVELKSRLSSQEEINVNTPLKKSQYLEIDFEKSQGVTEAVKDIRKTSPIETNDYITDMSHKSFKKVVKTEVKQVEGEEAVPTFFV